MTEVEKMKRTLQQVMKQVMKQISMIDVNSYNVKCHSYCHRKCHRDCEKVREV